MIRKLLCLLCGIVLLAAMLCIPVPASADTATLRNRKIVSVVYDDSGSMKNEKWEYTSYAMQCFAAMMNKEDALDITYMSTHQSGPYKVNTANRGAAVEAIRKHNDASGTPVESIQSAYNAMVAHKDTNPNTEYWLMVMTDGDMSGGTTAKAKIDELADKTMPNGTKPHIIFLTICDTNGQFTPSFAKSNIASKEAKTADEIRDVISGIACDISGRYAVDPKDILVLDDKTIEVKSDLPLFNMGILTQASTAKVKSVSPTLHEECNIPVAAPGKYHQDISAENFASLNGNVALFSAGNGHIAAGTYRITFSEPIKKENLVVMFEPAFELRLEVYSGENRVDDLSLLLENMTVNIQANLYEIGTDNLIPLSALPGHKGSISLSEGGTTTRTDNDLLLEDVVLKPTETKADARLEIPGYFTVYDSISFRPQTVTLSGMTASIYYDGSERRIGKDGNPDPENVVYITDLDKNATGVKFTLYIEEQPISKEKAELLKDDFVKGLHLDFDNYTVTVDQDGGIIVAPTDTWEPAVWFWLFHKGDSTIEASYGGQSASDTIRFEMGDWVKAAIELFWWLFWIFMAFYILLWIFAKKHFRKSGTIKVFTATRENDEFEQDMGKTKRIHWLAASDPLNFFGLRGMRKKIPGTPFSVRANGGGYLLTNVKGRSVSTSYQYPNPSNGVQPSVQSTHPFSNTVYAFDGTTYYKIFIGR